MRFIEHVEVLQAYNEALGRLCTTTTNPVYCKFLIVSQKILFQAEYQDLSHLSKPSVSSPSANPGSSAGLSASLASNLNGGLAANIASGSGAGGYVGLSRFYNSVPAAPAYPYPGAHIGGQRVAANASVLPPGLQMAAMHQVSGGEGPCEQEAACRKRFGIQSKYWGYM